MPSIRDLVTWFDQFAPRELAEDWDNVGLLLGDELAPLSSVLTCLTLTEDVADEAVERDVQCVVSHHPLMFRAVKRLTTTSPEGRTILKLLSAGIAVFSPHTRYDSADDGINAQLASGLGLTDCDCLRPREDGDGGAGRCGDLPQPMSVRELATTAGNNASSDVVQFTGNGDQSVTRVGIACGAAAEFLRDARRAGCDAFITGEARFHACLESRSTGIPLILLGHFASERPSMEYLAERIAANLNIEAIASQSECDPLQTILLKK